MSEPRRTSVPVGALLLALVGVGGTATAATGQDWRTMTSARQLWGTEPVEVEVEYGAGELEIGPARGGMLYSMELRYDEEQSVPVAEFDSASRRLKLGASNRRGNRKHREGSTATIALSDRIPLDLGLHFGAGEATLNLGGLRLQRLDVETGASETTIRFDSPNPIRAREVELSAGAAELEVIGLGNARAERISFQGGVGATTLDFGGAWVGDATASVQMGMGSVVLRFPRSLGVRISRSSFLTSFDAAGMVRRDGSYFSENWDRADHKLTVDVEAALGSIEIEWIGD
jgi:hypothetical protein